MEVPPFYTGIPFVVLLLLIAVMPLAAPHFWEKNRNRAIITAIVSLPAFMYLLSGHSPELVHNMKDYISFIALLGSLYIISGGILATGDVRATPAINTSFLVFGAILANFIGTTGASMVLIRPLLRTNSEREFTGHLPVFFIFIVSNIGGCLTPLADPPLFLGYLKGVPFLWTLSLYPIWLFTLTVVLALFFAWDTVAYRKESPAALQLDRERIAPLRVRGKINLLFLGGVVLAVFFQTPSPYRELIMALMTVLSLVFTPRGTRADNRFTFSPIIEVAILFAGIFVTMVPILTILRLRGAEFGITEPWQFFWLTGGLSSFLDNAPTYLTSFSLAQGVSAAAPAAAVANVAGVNVDLLRAISVGAVFMGANTYIGNGPNFMVKSIAEEQKVHIPHFFGYMGYSILILVPVFLLVTVIFFSG
ncbi:MAG TPA: sodium:proton antiporter [Candidatus Deferrimicrobium sp.]|nr:sodium:proton antiporter [Candidatus Deferrimicrobium sp.]